MTITRFFALLTLSFLCVSCASDGSHRTARVTTKVTHSNGVHFEGSY
jgi:hypothetical protein